MADFSSVIQTLKAGGTVRLGAWPPAYHLAMVKGQIMVVGRKGQKRFWNPTQGDLLSSDWEGILSPPESAPESASVAAEEAAALLPVSAPFEAVADGSLDGPLGEPVFVRHDAGALARMSHEEVEAVTASEAEAAALLPISTPFEV